MGTGCAGPRRPRMCTSSTAQSTDLGFGLPLPRSHSPLPLLQASSTWSVPPKPFTTPIPEVQRSTTSALCAAAGTSHPLKEPRTPSALHSLQPHAGEPSSAHRALSTTVDVLPLYMQILFILFNLQIQKRMKRFGFVLFFFFLCSTHHFSSSKAGLCFLSSHTGIPPQQTTTACLPWGSDALFALLQPPRVPPSPPPSTSTFFLLKVGDFCFLFFFPPPPLFFGGGGLTSSEKRRCQNEA